MSLERDEIEKLIPHSGTMVLLDRVLKWDATSISCWTESHRRLDNPLRRNEILPTVAGIEFAAQAMAVHGRLTDPETPSKKGLLGSLRDVEVNGDRLDNLQSPLLVDVKLLSGSSRGGIYSFSLSVDRRPLLTGRAVVFFL